MRAVLNTRARLCVCDFGSTVRLMIYLLPSVSSPRSQPAVLVGLKQDFGS